MLENGVEYIKIAPEELARWKKATAYMIDNYAKELNKRGLDGEKIIGILRDETGY